MRSDLLKSTTLERSNLSAIRLKIEYVAPAGIQPQRRVVRKHTDRQVRALAANINRIGFNVPLLVDDELRLVSGNARLAAAKLLGLNDVPVIRISHLTDEQLRLFSIFENKIGETTEWDTAALSFELDELRIAEPRIELSDSGFTIGEIDALAGRALTSALDDLVELPPSAAPEGPPISREGDLWLCGRHRLICGNSLDHNVIDRLVGNVPVQQLLVDPPYNVATRDISTSDRHSDFAMAAGEMSVEDFTTFLAGFLEAAKPKLVDGALAYVFMDWKHVAELLSAGQLAKFSYKQLLVWVKSQAGMGSFYRSGHELCAVFQHGAGKPINNLMMGASGRNRSNVLSYPSIVATAGGRKALKLHPTVKNIALIADLILDVTRPGDAILDCFGGSGTTLIAAEKTDRQAFLCELSPVFIDRIVARFNALGGPQATLEATGQSLNEVQADRLAEGGHQ